VTIVWRERFDDFLALWQDTFEFGSKLNKSESAAFADSLAL
jgi:hypothetical protein